MRSVIPKHKMRIRDAKTLGILAWVCALSPMALFLALLSFAIHVRLGLGHWPTPMFENYETPLSSFHEGAMVVLGYFCILVGPPIWLGVTVLNRAVGSVQFKKQLIIYLAGWALILIAGVCDPTTFSEWLLD